jgi:hypothetical protein
MPVPDFSPGEVLTAAAMDSVAMWLVKTQTVGAGVSSVTVTDAFSADFDVYRILLTGGTGTANANIVFQLGATVSGYYGSYVHTAWNNTVIGQGTTTATSWVRAGRGSTTTDNNYMSCDVQNPFKATNTRFFSNFVSAFDGGMFVGLMPNTTSYTDFTLIPATGTLTGGVIHVYGYRK